MNTDAKNSLFQKQMADVYTNSEKHVVLSNNVKMPILGLGEKKNIFIECWFFITKRDMEQCDVVALQLNCVS